MDKCKHCERPWEPDNPVFSPLDDPRRKAQASGFCSLVCSLGSLDALPASVLQKRYVALCDDVMRLAIKMNKAAGHSGMSHLNVWASEFRALLDKE
jgi:hypothetical protein